MKVCEYAAAAAVHSSRAKTVGVVSSVLIAIALCGCASMRTPERLYPVEEEFTAIKTGVAEIRADFDKLNTRQKKYARNAMITARKYAIDLQYTQYESALTNEVQLADFGAKAANLALTGTAELVRAQQTKDLLTGIGTGVLNLDSAYSEKVLRARLIENIQSSMRSARHERAAVIYANMRCSIGSYPVAMALSDLEAYYRAGTFTAGLIKLSQTVAEKEKQESTNADAQKPGNSDAQARLEGAVAEAVAKSDIAKNTTARNAKCTEFSDEG